MTRKKSLLILLILALCAGAAYWYAQKSRAAARTRILATTRVERGSVRRVLEATGVIKAQVGASVKIGAQATGAISRVFVRVGDPVKKGQVVAEIDDRELRAQRAEAAARLKLAEAKAGYESVNLPRHQILVRQQLEAQSTLDEAVQDYRVARADAEAAKAALATLNVRMSYTKIVSPIDGVVSQVTAQEGETVVAGLQVANLVTVLDPSRLEMWIYVDETDVGRVRPGLPVEFRVDSQPGRTFKGAVNRVYPDPEIRDNIVYYKALVTVDHAEAAYLRPEMTTQCDIVVDTHQGVLTVPNQALKWVAGQQTVFVVDKAAPEGLRRVHPRLGLAGLEKSEVIGGLAEGDEVATQVVLGGEDAPKGDNAQSGDDQRKTDDAKSGPKPVNTATPAKKAG